MRIACLGRAARIAIITLAAAAVTLWTSAGLLADHITSECFALICHGATSSTLALTVVIVGLVIRDGVRDSLIGRVRATPPGAGERPHLAAVRDEETG